MALLNNSDRHLLKATYAPLEFDTPEGVDLGRAMDKASFVRGLQLQTGEVATIRRNASANIPAKVWDTLQTFEPTPVSSLAPPASVLADIPTQHLAGFGEALLQHRTSAKKVRSTQAPAATERSRSLGAIPRGVSEWSRESSASPMRFTAR